MAKKVLAKNNKIMSSQKNYIPPQLLNPLFTKSLLGLSIYNIYGNNCHIRLYSLSVGVG